MLGALPQALIGRVPTCACSCPGCPPLPTRVLHQRDVCAIGPVFRRGPGRACASAACRTARWRSTSIDAPASTARAGSPYQDSDGAEWPDNLQRFALLGWVAAHLASGELDPDWAPAHRPRPRLARRAGLRLPRAPSRRGARQTVFTVHNLAYQGLFPGGDFSLLGLPARLMAPSGLEYYGRCRS